MSEANQEKKPVVSVSLTTYQHEKYVREALEGIYSQKTDFPMEVLIHDDASPDGTQEIIREYEKQYPDITRCILQTENQYQKGIRTTNYTFNFLRAEGKYIAICEGDDYWTDPKKLQKQVSYMEAHPECHLCVHAVADVDEQGNRLTSLHSCSESKALSTDEVIRVMRGFAFVSFLVRTEDVQKLPDFYFGAAVGDLPLVLYLASLGTVYYIDEEMANYRHHGGSWTDALWSGDIREKLRHHLDRMIDLYRQFDTYTGEKYHESVEFAIQKTNMEYCMGVEDFRGILNPAYKEAFRQLPITARIGYRMGAVLPGLYHFLKPFFMKK
ncbi:MAG: glycosyltransferase [Lachnospiraceae bacterium]|nr:glycosyltransferase [Lachnospiraceae bacterium]